MIGALLVLLALFTFAATLGDHLARCRESQTRPLGGEERPDVTA
jgi:hypothetical protein